MLALVHIFSDCNVITLWNCRCKSVDSHCNMQHSRLDSRHSRPSPVGHSVRWRSLRLRPPGSGLLWLLSLLSMLLFHIQPQAKLSVDMELILGTPAKLSCQYPAIPYLHSYTCISYIHTKSFLCSVFKKLIWSYPAYKNSSRERERKVCLSRLW